MLVGVRLDLDDTLWQVWGSKNKLLRVWDLDDTSRQVKVPLKMILKVQGPMWHHKTSLKTANAFTRPKNSKVEVEFFYIFIFLK